MDKLDLQALRQAREWRAQGRAVWLLTVVETWGSAPRPAGALMAIGDDGQVAGSVSGGCVEDDLVDRLRSGERLARPTLVGYGESAEEAARFGLPCGGRLRLLQERLDETAWIDELLERTGRQELVARRLELATGQVSIESAARGERFSFDGRVLRALFGPRWRLLLIGAGELSRAVASMALMLDFEVSCCDPRESYAPGWDLPRTQFSREMPDDVVLAMKLDTHSAVLALTHDPKLDDMALLEALKSPAFYVGALGSRRSSMRRRERLALFDLGPAQIERLHAPVGLNLGSRVPAEIAVAIVAELVAVRNGVAVEQGRLVASTEPVLPDVG